MLMSLEGNTLDFTDIAEKTLVKVQGRISLQIVYHKLLMINDITY